jgi:hypothetical protein
MDGSNWGEGPERYWYPDDREAALQNAHTPGDLKSFFAGDRRRALRWSAGVAAAAVLAAGAAIAGVALAGHGSQPANQGAALSAAVNPTASPSPGTSKAGARKRALARLRALRGVHGEATFRTKNGFREIAWERGVIESVSSQDVVVRSPDGATWTWALAGNTAVRDQGTKASTSNLANGDQVLVAGPESGSTRTARVIIIPKKAASSSSPATGAAPPSTAG